MNILVTGGAGFIGSNFIKLLLKEHPEHAIINLDALTYAASKQTILEFSQNYPRYQFVYGDITNQKLVEQILKGGQVDVIVNFAAESHVDRSIQSAQPFIRTNVEGTRALLDAARITGTKKFMQISTDEVYGTANEGVFTETTILNPRSPYSASKAAAEHLANSYFITYGLPVLITRSSNNYGAYQFPEKFIPVAITNLIEGKKIPVYAQGKNVRDWLHVEDNCKAILSVLEKGKIGEVYNIGASGEEHTNITVARMIATAFGKGDDAIEFVADRPGHDFRYALSSEKIKTELGWKPQKTFEEGLRETIQWYKENEEWWKPLKQRVL
ncbi:dTDP-glucose 4,6-dehydratase [Candidatus Woesearchaeota archaeon]|nr:dTDP-glucose 4,6-dehydratase [Candidatus Woesearchaeota archaeon]